MPLYSSTFVRSGVAGLGLLLGFSAMPAMAGCYESGIGCTYDHLIPKPVLQTLSCDALWTIRNAIYDEHGYCFKTKRAKDAFDNGDCTVTNASKLGFNSFEQKNIDRIASVEKQYGCN